MIQAAIVAGGRGERMRPATDSLPKPMMDVGGKPLLQRQLEWLRESGIRDVAMCLGYKAEVIRDHFGDHFGEGAGRIQLHYQVESVPRGTAGSVLDLGSWIKGDLLIVYGDLYIAMDCRGFLDCHSHHTGAATLLVRATDHPGDSDLVQTDSPMSSAKEARIKSIYRSKESGENNLACAAIWAIRPALLKYVPSNAPSDFAKDIFPKALAGGETLRAYRTEEQVLDLGTPERAQAFLKQWQARR